MEIAGLRPLAPSGLPAAGPIAPQQGPPAQPALLTQGQGEDKANALVQWTPHGRKLAFSPEDLHPVPEKWSGDGWAQARKIWARKVPVFVRKALAETHFQQMTVQELRDAIERSVEEALRRDREGRKARQRRRNEAKGLAASGEPLSEVVLLRNMVGRGELDDELYDDVVEEASRFGRVVSATAFEEEDDSDLADEEAVRVFVRFADSAAASACQQAMHLRVFGGRRIAASFYPLERYLGSDLAHDPAADKPLPAQCKERVTPPEPQQQPLPVPPCLPAEVLALMALIEQAAADPAAPPCRKLLAMADPEGHAQLLAEEAEAQRAAAAAEAEKAAAARAAEEAKLAEERRQAAAAAVRATTDVNDID
eukprot:TRINITY_DN1442_c0_g3_i1.p1 TRINITY_DN1442_c0_g3~~TRINITY_DN1442_c0_g3_i1.p1  ORF type:complete len:367 (+),score=100.97 TRINITY_DN1442_c0_g3_i1:115-1215(+)